MPQITDTCRHCGATGEIDPELDPCPHVCPKCMVEGGTATVIAGSLLGLDKASERAWVREHLIADVGFTPEYAEMLAAGDQDAINRNADQVFLTHAARYGVDSPS